MVNNNSDRTAQILKTLKSMKSVPVSGEIIAEQLGISRVAVWKKIQALRQAGYVIDSSASGYILVSGTDKPLPWEIDNTDSTIKYYAETKSTMPEAWLLIDSGCDDGSTVIAESQTEGRSSDGGAWQSPEGGLYITRVRTRPLPASFGGLYSLGLCSIVCDLLYSDFGLHTEIIWPSGIFAAAAGLEGKIGGVLTEHKGKNGTLDFMASGIGLNINTESEDLPEDAVSLQLFTGKRNSIKEITIGLISRIENFDKIFPKNKKEIVSSCSRRIKGMGAPVSVTTVEGLLLKGRLSGLNSDGSLKLECDNELICIFSGDKIIYE